jgi:ribonucleoside-diphosphate reductase alpha chain
MSDALKLTPSARTVLEKRYLIKDDDGKVIETPEELFRRVAHFLAQADANYGKSAKEIKKTEEDFYAAMSSLQFLPNSPTLMNSGRPLGQLSACFVLPIGDSLEEIFTTVKQAALIHQSGGGTGFSFSRLRPRGDIVRSTKGVSSGPVSFMEVMNSATEAIKQGGTRRGANMGILRVDHPDILEFITCKKDHTRITNFNISVALTEKFMEAVEKDEEFELKNPRTGVPLRKMKAKEVFDLLVKQAWENGDPGIVFLDRINKTHPTPNLGLVESTNPCGEQPLMPYESCNLGSIDLSKMVKAVKSGYEVDWDKLREITRLSVHLLDNVIDMNKYPIPEIAEMTRKTRKIGLGIMGWADMLIKLGIPYNSEDALLLAEKVMEFIWTEGREKSRELAKERGAFPAFKGSRYDEAGDPPQRNSTITTIAPTGTIGIIAGASQGVEPVFALAYIRKTGLAGNIGDVKLTEVNELFLQKAKEGGFYSEELMKKIAEHGSCQGMLEVPEEVRKVFVTAHDITPEWHIRMQAAFQKFTDNAVSKTVNFSHDATIEDVAKVYMMAYKLGCKGVTVYRDGSRQIQVLNVGAAKEGEKKETEVKPKPTTNVNISLTGGNGDMLQPHEDNPVVDAPDRFAQTVATAESFEPPVETPVLPGIEPGADKGVTTERIFVKPRPRPDVSIGTTAKILTGCGNLYVTINSDENGPVELFAQLGKSGGCVAAHTEALGRMASLALQAGVDPELLNKQLKGIRCPRPAFDKGSITLSCADGVAKALQMYLNGKTDKKDLKKLAASKDESYIKNLGGNCPECPECGQMLEFQEGCVVCKSCGYSQCG